MRSRLHILGLLVLLGACGSDGDAVRADAGADAPLADAPGDAPSTVNGCTRAGAVDLSAMAADRIIQISDDLFTPKCPRITVGQSLTWRGDFGTHPLAPGILLPGEVMAQPGNPIPQTVNGGEVEVTFPTAGTWAFYCPNHPPGMAGVVYVDP